MPSGYTAKIAEGITFKQFALSCARAFGALIMMRDDPMDAKIPDEVKPDDYHLRRKEELLKEWKEIENKSPKEIQKIIDSNFDEAMERYNKRKKDAADLRAKYEKILAEAKSWNPPSPDHTGLKDFMIEQVESSIKWDCDTSYDTVPVKESIDEFLKERRADIQRDILYHEENYAKEVQRAKERTEWIVKLKQSLPK